MGDGERLAALIDAAHDAAFDDGLWPAWLERLVATFDGIGGTFFAFDPTGPDRFLPLWDFKPGGLEEYEAVWAPHDSQRNFVAALPRPTVYRDMDHADRTDPTTDSFVRWAEAVGGIGHHIGAITFTGPREVAPKVGQCVHRRVGHGHVGDTHHAMMTAALPALTSAFTLAFSHGAALRTAYWEGVGQRNQGEAMLLLDERGRVLSATPGALSLVGAGDGLRLTGNGLRAGNPGEDARIAALAGAAVAPHGPVGGATRIARPSGRAPYVVIAHPLPRAQRMIAPLEAAALVTIVDPAATPPVAADLWRSAFGFTAREGEMATLLMTGHSAESAAAVLEIGLPTARIHLRRLLAKTGTGRQSELVRLLARVS